MEEKKNKKKLIAWPLSTLLEETQTNVSGP